MFQLDVTKLEDGENIESLEKKFLANHFDKTSLGKFSDLRNLIISGRDFSFVRSGYRHVLARLADTEALSNMPRAQRGEAEEIKKVREERDIDELTDEERENLGKERIGYSGIEDWACDQKSIYDLEFHN